MKWLLSKIVGAMMSQPTNIEKLTPEQEALIPGYREKWRAMARSTERIDRQKATVAVKLAYSAIGFQKPEILFCDSPSAIWKTFILSGLNSLGYKLDTELVSQLATQLENQLTNQLWDQLQGNLPDNLSNNWSNQLQSLQEYKICGYMQPCRIWVTYGSLLDFGFSVLNCKPERRKWEAFQLLAKYCTWIYPFEKACFVCDRPTKLSFDNEQRLHGSGEPAIKFADGCSLYAYHGVILPEKYAAVHPHQWRSQWILSEDNAELRRVLIQGIGYARICQELQATELDSWREYTLLEIDGVDEDEAPIYLLKMTCPSTGFIHALRVPPDMISAREAIAWVNWGTDPEEFAVQT